MTRRPLFPHVAASSLFANLPGELLESLEPELEPVELVPGESLFRQGDTGDALYVLVAGELEVRIATDAGADVVVDRLQPGASVGEMALVAGHERTASVVAATPARLARLARQGFERLALEHPALHEAVVHEMAPRLQRVQLSGVLAAWFSALDESDVHALQEAVDWVRLSAGERLYSEGDPADGMYLLVSGRLRVSGRDAEGVERARGEIGRGESIGEYAVLGDASRSESVTALRDSHLVRLGRDLVAQNPQVMAQIARNALERAHRGSLGGGRKLRLSAGNGRGPVTAADGNGVRTFAVVPSPGVAPAMAVARLLGEQLGEWGTALVLDAAAVDEAFGREEAAQTPSGSPSDPALTHWLNEREARYDYLVLLTDGALTPWTRRCLRQADQVLIVGRAADDPSPGPVEREAHRVNSVTQLVLVQPDDAALPSGTGRWLDARDALSLEMSQGERAQGEQEQVARLPVHQLRLSHGGDASRMARRLTGRAVGLVFSGGGARGFVHIGLIRALEELGIAVDMLVGTSMGALIGGTYAIKLDYQYVHANAPLGDDPKKLIDRTLPLVAFTESRAVTRVMHELYGDVRIEDLWIPFACVSANLTRAEPVVHQRGPMWEAVRASTAIPGIFTPVVHRGDVLVDGGVMNNFPVDIMRDWVGPGVVIGSNASTQSSRDAKYEFGPSVSGWQVLLQRFLPRERRVRVPTIFGTLMRATSLSSKHLGASAGALADLTIRYPTQDFGNLEFGRQRELMDIGYRQARVELERWLGEHGVAATGEAVAPVAVGAVDGA